MKIVIINSSFRKNGNTEHIMKLLEESLCKIAENKNIRIEFEHLTLSELNLALCRGCRVCFDKGEELCPLNDNIAEVRTKLFEADGMILGSPVYVEDVNGPMKNLIDRLAFYCHRPAFFGKNALILTTSGGGSTKHALRTMKNALNSWGYNIPIQNQFRMGAYMKAVEVEKNYSDIVYRLSDKFFNTLVNKKPNNPSFYLYLIFKVQQKYWQKDINQNKNLDYEYWRKNGWLDSHCDFYVDHKPSLLKSRAARAIGGIIALYFT